MKYYMAVNLHNVNMPKFFKNCRIKKMQVTTYAKHFMINMQCPI